MTHSEAKRAFAPREHQFGGHGNVRDKLGLFEEMQNGACESKIQVGMCVKVDEQVEEQLRRTPGWSDGGSRRQVDRVVKGTQGAWLKFFPRVRSVAC